VRGGGEKRKSQAGAWRSRVAGALLLAGCGTEERARSAVLITMDTTRVDALSCYGNREATSPAIDALAADGIVFDAAHTVMALTLPAHTSMLTGLAPLRHGLRDNGVGALPEGADTVAERARAAGLETAAFVSSVVLDDDFGLQQGFDTYSVPDRRGAVERAHGAERGGTATVDAALAWLASRDDGRDAARPFFLWVHLYDPHHPYQPPADFARFSTPYLGEVAAMDREIGRLFAALRERGLWDETFVLALADHGEAFGEHGEVTHGTFVYETTLAIPLVARWPLGARPRGAGTRSDELVSALDVAPTLVEALGLEPLAGIDGLSFFARPLPAERGAYFESYYGYLSCGWSPLSGWIDGRGKYIHSSEPEYYDWRADRAERTDLASTRSGELERYRSAIGLLASEPALAVAALGDEEALADIQALGYASSGEGADDLPHPLAPSTLPSPRSQAGFFAKQARAQDLTAAGREAEAAAIYAEVLRETPGNHFALEELGTLEVQLGRTDEAIAHLERLAHDGPQRGKAYLKLGLALVTAGRHADAVAPLTRAVELTGGRPRYLDALQEALVKLGRGGEIVPLRAKYARASGG
jgi:choline-sulfatase